MSEHHDQHLKGSAVRLWQLVAQRAQPGADKAQIDERIWDLFGDDWAGKRVRLITKSVSPETGAELDFWWDLPDVMGRKELEQYWADKIVDYTGKCERLRAFWMTEKVIVDTTHTIIIAERRY